MVWLEFLRAYFVMLVLATVAGFFYLVRLIVNWRRRPWVAEKGAGGENAAEGLQGRARIASLWLRCGRGEPIDLGE